MNYADAKDLMEVHRSHVAGKKGYMAGKDPDRKVIGNSTWLTRYAATKIDKEHYSIGLFNTTNNIIDFFEDFVELNDHGWFSKTTHARFNEFMPRGFHVWGSKYNHLTVPRPLGFIRTPTGTYPYARPMAFNYDGEPKPPLKPYADEIVAALPQLVEQYLTMLLDGTVSTDEALTKPFVADDLAGAAVEFSNAQYMGLTIQEIVEILKKSGASAFSKAAGRAVHMEAVLLHRMPIPVIGKQWLRSKLRPLMHDHLIEQMGFAEVSWNRR